MKRCPTCDKTFADGMRFCQTDGTVLVDDAPAADPYKTVVSNQSEIPVPPADPFKTMVASPPTFAKDEDEVLQSPDELDEMKTILVSRDELKSSEAEDVPKLDLPPPSPFNSSAPLIEPSSPNPSSFGDLGQESSSPESSGTNPNDTSAATDSSSFQENPAPKFDSKPFENDFSQKSPYGNQENKAIPSPFQDSIPHNYQSPYTPPFDEPQPPMQQSEPMFGGQPESASQSPFEQSPFSQPEPFNPPMQQTEWTPPPAPVSEWQNQNLGANQPFQPSGASVGQNQTLAIVSLVCGILSIFCCGWVVPGIAAVVLGYIAKNKADQNPNEYGGRGLALGGMITGGISIILGIIVIILYLFTGLLAGIGNLN